MEFFKAHEHDGTPRLLQLARCRLPETIEGEEAWAKFVERLPEISRQASEAENVRILDQGVVESAHRAEDEGGEHGVDQGGRERLVYWLLPWSPEAEPLGQAPEPVAVTSEPQLARIAQTLLERVKARHQRGLVDPLLSADLMVRSAAGEVRFCGLSVHVPDEWLIGAPESATRRAPEEISRKGPVRSGDLWRVGRALARFAAPLGGLSNDFSRILALLNHADPSYRYIRPIDALIDIEKLDDRSTEDAPDATLAIPGPIVRDKIEETAQEATHPGRSASSAQDVPSASGAGVPSWAYMLTRERFDLLVRLIRRDLEAREINFHIGTGVVVITPISRDRTYEFDLTELARTVSSHEPARWPGLVGDYFDARLAQTTPPPEAAAPEAAAPEAAPAASRQAFASPTPTPPAPFGIAQADTIADQQLPEAIRAAADEDNPTILNFPRAALQAAQEATRLRPSVASSTSEIRRRSTLSFVDPGDPLADIPATSTTTGPLAQPAHRPTIAPSDTVVLSAPSRDIGATERPSSAETATAEFDAPRPKSAERAESKSRSESDSESESAKDEFEDEDDAFDPFAARRNLFAIVGLALLAIAVAVAVLFPELITSVSIESDTPFSVISADNEVVVDADPPGAEIVGEIDGRVLGTAPVRILVPRRQPTAVLVGAPGYAPQRLLLPDRGRVSTTLERIDPDASCEVVPDIPSGAQLEGIAATIGVGARVRVPGAAIVRAKNVRGAWILRCPSMGGPQAPALDRRRQFTSVNLDITEPEGMAVRIDDQPAGVVPISVEIQRGFVEVNFDVGGRSQKRWVAAMTDIALRLDGTTASVNDK